VVERRPLELADLYRLYAKSVARWAYLLGGPRIDPEDVMQEVFIVAHRQLPKLDNQEHLSAWLYRVTANVVRNRRRKNQARDLIQEALSFGATGDGGQTPAQTVERKQTHALVYEILDQMKDKYRTVIIMFELEGMSGEEIAKTLDVKLSTLWVWLHRARQDFLVRLKKAQEKGR
jgi:RNA polymerase sigma-70 factor (ECF subfamily)